MKNEIFDNMLSRYDLTTEQHKRNAIFEVNQQVILAGLYSGGFFESAAFYGGTCLRIFHGLQRFSEDMDFSLLAHDDNFDFTKYFPAIIDAFAMVGREVEIKKKDKKNFRKVESAFLKDNTDVYDVTFQTEKSIKIKIEVDTCPPLNFKTEQKLLLLPHSFMTHCFILPDLFAGKMHALVYRAWKNRLKAVIGTILNGMYAIMFRWILLIWQNDASSSTMRILLQSYLRRNSLSASLQLI